MFRKIIFASLLAVAAVGTTGCYVEAEGPEPAVSDGYEPQYYDGYVVYYDEGGRPYYNVNGGVVFVQPSSPYYGRLVTHYRTYGPAYHRWYGRSGARYRTYRARGHRR